MDLAIPLISVFPFLKDICVHVVCGNYQDHETVDLEILTELVLYAPKWCTLLPEWYGIGSL